MNEKQVEVGSFTLSGWQAVAGVVVILALAVGSRFFFMHSLDNTGKEAARQYLAVEYIRENMPAADSVSSMTAAKASALADTL
ncbi:MAG: hypothetical protein JRI97_03350, partial [Deltaproteobacteria bacterium]|nr:hypothetical protein [Deltaproteobacteria bacterium]